MKQKIDMLHSNYRPPLNNIYNNNLNITRLPLLLYLIRTFISDTLDFYKDVEVLKKCKPYTYIHIAGHTSDDKMIKLDAPSSTAGA